MRWSHVDLGRALTETERHVVALVVSGATNKAVARDLAISVKTVEFHLSNVYRKLGVSSRHELTQVVVTATANGSSGTVTFLAVRFDPSGELWARRSGASVGDDLARACSHAREFLEGRGGRTVTVSPGVVVAAFDVAWRAVRAAVELVQEGRVDAMVASAAVHTGAVDWVGGGYIGGALDTVQRIGAMTRPGQVLLSAAVVGLLDDTFDVEWLGDHHLGGQRPEGLYLAAGPVAVGLGQVDGGLGNLPSATELVGRDRELSDLADLLTNRRLTSVVGPGGVGKTALAVAAARAATPDWRHGRWFVDLAAVREPTDVPVATVAALRLLSSHTTMTAHDVADLIGAQRRLNRPGIRGGSRPWK